MATPTTAQMPQDVEEYDKRWENHWNVGPDGTGLKAGQMWDSQDSPPSLKALIASGALGPLEDKRAFVPGCGRGYDLVTFVKAGVKEAIGLDLAPTAVTIANSFEKTALGEAQAAKATVLQGNFFTYTSPTGIGFDIGFDYTFFCALMPKMRADWGPAWHRILRPGGLLVTLIFPVDPTMPEQGPPWPVNPELYKEHLLSNGFALRSLEKVPEEQSHPKRGGREWMAVWERLP